MWKCNEALHRVQTPYPFQLCNDYFDIMKRLVWLCPVRIFAQCVCWELFHPITPYVSSMWFLLSSTSMLYFLVFLFFWDDLTNWEYCCESAIIYSMDATLQFPLIVHYLYMSRGASTQTICVSWRLWSMGFKLLENTTLFLFLMHPYSSTGDVEPG